MLVAMSAMKQQSTRLAQTSTSKLAICIETLSVTVGVLATRSCSSCASVF